MNFSYVCILCGKSNWFYELKKKAGELDGFMAITSYDDQYKKWANR